MATFEKDGNFEVKVWLRSTGGSSQYFDTEIDAIQYFDSIKCGVTKFGTCDSDIVTKKIIKKTLRVKSEDNVNQNYY